MKRTRALALALVLLAGTLGVAKSTAAQDVQPIAEPNTDEVGTNASQPIVFDCWGGLTLPYKAFGRARVDVRTWCNNGLVPMAASVNLYRSGGGLVANGANGVPYPDFTVEAAASTGCIEGYYWADGEHIVWLPNGVHGTLTYSNGNITGCIVNPSQSD